MLPTTLAVKVLSHTVDQAVSFRHLIIIPTLFLVSCTQKPEEEPEPAPAPQQEEVVPEVVEPEPPKPLDPGLTFAVPDSTNQLMNDDEKKTVLGPVAPLTAPVEEDNAINVDPPKPPEAVLPDEG
ncbi:hypothetical protein V2O64_03550 [Verrucomicrobiaceae bacterium 227]